MIKIIIIIILIIVGICSLCVQNTGKKIGTIVLIIAGTIILNVFTEYTADWMKHLFFSEERTTISGTANPDGGQDSAVRIPNDAEDFPEEDNNVQWDLKPTETSGQNTKTAQPSAAVPASSVNPEPEPTDPLSLLEDISSQTSVSGSVVEKGQVNQYLYMAPTDGHYLFDTGLSWNERVWMEITNEYGGRIARNTSSLSVDLNAGTVYILRVEYDSSPRDYTVRIGIPKAVSDITGQTSVSGSVTYRGQVDQYLYTAPLDGTYLFDTGLGWNETVWVEISNEYGGQISRNTSSVLADLTGGTTYILRVEYASSPQNYTVQIGIPKPVSDITGLEYVTGGLTYRGQKDRYLYTAPVDGSYLFDTGLGFNGGVYLEIGDENGTRINRHMPTLTVDLKGGTTYMLSVYRENNSTPCDYTVSIEIQ